MRIELALSGLMLPALDTERVADLSKQDYTPELNQHFTPDGRWLVYRSNVEGKPVIYAVEAGK